MAINGNKIVSDIKAMEAPDYDWDGMCSQVAWYCHRVTGTPKNQIKAYDPARLGYWESKIVSHDYNAAPAGAFHWWDHPHPEGHVAFALGGGQALMASGVFGWPHIGIISVADYNRRTGNPYLGWSNTFGTNVDIRNRFIDNQNNKGDFTVAQINDVDKKLADIRAQFKNMQTAPMLQVRNKADGKVYVVNPTTGDYWLLPNQAYKNLWVSRGLMSDDVIDVPKNEFDHFIGTIQRIGVSARLNRIESTLKAISDKLDK